MRKKVISAKAAEKKTPRSLNTRYHVFVIFSGPRESDDFRGSHASGTAVCPSCRDAVHDLKRSAASPPRLFAVCQSTICRFVFHAPWIRSARHGRRNERARYHRVSYTEHHTHCTRYRKVGLSSSKSQR